MIKKRITTYVSPDTEKDLHQSKGEKTVSKHASEILTNHFVKPEADKQTPKREVKGE